MDHVYEEQIIPLSCNLKISEKQTFAFEALWLDGLDWTYLESRN